jgi:hypothetical protein
MVVVTEMVVMKIGATANATGAVSESSKMVYE